jgi:hypothetical protein
LWSNGAGGYPQLVAELLIAGVVRREGDGVEAHAGQSVSVEARGERVAV